MKHTLIVVDADQLHYRNLSPPTRQENPMEFKINKKPWESKKWLMAAAGFAVLTAEVMAGINLPDELVIGQVLLILGYLGVQAVDDVKGRDDANEAKRLDLLGKLPPQDPPLPG